MTRISCALGLAVLLAPLVLGGCATETTDGLQVTRGHYVFGHEVRSLRPCGEEEALWVIDRTGLLARLHGELTPGSRPYAEVFAVVAGRVGPPTDGFGADYPGALAVEDVIYVAFEGFGCSFDWGRFIYRAQGNEPFWMAEVRSSEMRLTRPGEPDLVWTDATESSAARGVVIRSQDPPVELHIEPEPGRDTMSGAYFGLSARLLVEGETLAGNALRGTARNPSTAARETR